MVYAKYTQYRQPRLGSLTVLGFISAKLVFVQGVFYLKYLLETEEGETNQQTKDNPAARHRIPSVPQGCEAAKSEGAVRAPPAIPSALPGGTDWGQREVPKG